MAASPAARGMRLASLALRSHHPKFVADCVNDVRTSAAKMGIQMSGTIFLPTKKRKFLNILKSPHVHKKAVAQYQMDYHKRLIEFYGNGTTGQEAANVVHFLRYLEHTILQLHPGCMVRTILYSDEAAERQGDWRSASSPPPQGDEDVRL